MKITCFVVFFLLLHVLVLHMFFFIMSWLCYLSGEIPSFSWLRMHIFPCRLFSGFPLWGLFVCFLVVHYYRHTLTSSFHPLILSFLFILFILFFFKKNALLRFKPPQQRALTWRRTVTASTGRFHHLSGVCIRGV
ncbi:hypothetical protein, unlikely [Trypanosoma brucei gambiense DAL972]|uniref:Uncharacterized protein n=1 Tax=Trypanosoma brucei gambiense (strain MHOM/CI/86/DAL972) TaxID=679716 RepID=C9ZKM0_TRYB9|nr:hypothetical protein, unlikely [Trypanosoma brucei gambiense DAL972]CBH10236.1 hypothetical protein, unlikely [Trypanosoma brucei gambiense DAL972]|eukprot:XP_011772526.1 hypothetical protein, unlikely [Trypanosoma brucei gambiense DAL972]